QWPAPLARVSGWKHCKFALSVNKNTKTRSCYYEPLKQLLVSLFILYKLDQFFVVLSKYLLPSNHSFYIYGFQFQICLYILEMEFHPNTVLFRLDGSMPHPNIALIFFHPHPSKTKSHTYDSNFLPQFAFFESNPFLRQNKIGRAHV